MRNLTGEQYAASKYIKLDVTEPMPLMEFLMKEMSGISRNKVKDLLQGHGIQVDRKLVTQYDFMLSPGQTVLVSRHKRSTELLNKASARFGSRERSFGMMLRITYGIQNMMCANRSVTKPFSICSALKNIKSPMAVTISGFIIGSSLTCSTQLLRIRFDFERPMAVSVPTMVDTTVAITAITTV